MQAAGQACGSLPPGLSFGGAPHKEIRFYTDPTTGLPASREGGTTLLPERSTNYSLGFELAPQLDFFAATPEGQRALDGTGLKAWLARMNARPSMIATQRPEALRGAA